MLLGVLTVWRKDQKKFKFTSRGKIIVENEFHGQKKLNLEEFIFTNSKQTKDLVTDVISNFLPFSVLYPRF